MARKPRVAERIRKYTSRTYVQRYASIALAVTLVSLSFIGVRAYERTSSDVPPAPNDLVLDEDVLSDGVATASVVPTPELSLTPSKPPKPIVSALPSLNPNPTNSLSTNQVITSPTSTASEISVNLEEIGLYDGNQACREIRVTSNVPISDYTVISSVSGQEVYSVGGNPNSSVFIYGVCQKSGAIDYFLTLYSTTGLKKVTQQHFTFWRPADSYPTPTPSPIPPHDPLNATWEISPFMGENVTLYCEWGKPCVTSNQYERAVITANTPLVKCDASYVAKFSQPSGGNSVNYRGATEVHNDTCTIISPPEHSVTFAEIESIYGEKFTLGNAPSEGQVTIQTGSRY